MFTKDLIKVLQKLVDDNEPHKDVMGGHEIMIGQFKGPDAGNFFNYAGISPDIKITKTTDGVYDVLTAFAPDR